MTSKNEQVEKNVTMITIEVEAEKFEKAMAASYTKNKKKFKVNGFRPGTAPRQIIEQMYGEHVFYEDAVDSLIGPAYEEALKESKLEPVTMPEIDIKQIGKGKDFIFTAKIATKPEVKLGKYKEIKVEASNIEVSEDEIQAEINSNAEKNARIMTVEDRATKEKDTVNIDFEGSVNGVAFEGGTAKGYDLVLGSKTFIDNFEEQLIGKKNGEEVVVKVKFPDEYGNKELSGKDAEFKVTINSITEKVLPEINDELAQDISEFDTLDEYKADLKVKIASKKEKEANAARQNKILEQVCEKAELEIPEIMINGQVSVMLNRFSQNLQAQGMTLNDFVQYTGGTLDDLKEHYKKDAEREIKMALVLDAVAQKEKIEVTDEDVTSKVKEMSSRIGKSVNEVKELLGGRIAELKEELVIEKTIKFLEDNTVEK